MRVRENAVQYSLCEGVREARGVMHILEVFDGHLDFALALLVRAARGGQRSVESLGAPARLLELPLCTLHARTRRFQLPGCANASPITVHVLVHSQGECTVKCTLYQNAMLKSCCSSPSLTIELTGPQLSDARELAARAI